MNYKKQKRDQIDRCNICGNLSALTWDHVPPKSTLIERNTYADRLFAKAELPKENRYMDHYQSGIKYRTICSKCNNDVLGENDKVYKQFVDMVVQQLRNVDVAMQQGLVLPQHITIKTKINRLLRAIGGHFLSMKPVYDEFAEADNVLRSYVLDETLRLEKEKLFCWFYPNSTVVIARDVMAPGYFPKTHPKGTFSMMASYPLAFLISSEDECDCNVDNLSRYSTKNIEDTIEISLHFETSRYSGSNKLKDFLWPMNVTGQPYGALMALGNEEVMEGSRIGITKK